MLSLAAAPPLDNTPAQAYSPMPAPIRQAGSPRHKRPRLKTIEPGRITRVRLLSNREQVYYLYVPHTIRQPGALFVSVHGISRNAKEHARRFAAYAEQQGIVMLCPRFARDQGYGRHFQRLRSDPSGTSAAEVLNQIIDETDQRLAICTERLYLFGFSGGGQFVHRYLMAYPERVASAVIGAAGWYTFPDQGVRYPRGLKPNPNYRHRARFPDYLSIPILVVVGEWDHQRDEALNSSPRIDRQQGRDRIERGRRWIEAMQSAAAEAGMDTTYQLQLLPASGHSFSDAMTQGQAGASIWGFLFGELR